MFVHLPNRRRKVYLFRPLQSNLKLDNNADVHPQQDVQSKENMSLKELVNTNAQLQSLIKTLQNEIVNLKQQKNTIPSSSSPSVIPKVLTDIVTQAFNPSSSPVPVQIPIGNISTQTDEIYQDISDCKSQMNVLQDEYNKCRQTAEIVNRDMTLLKTNYANIELTYKNSIKEKLDENKKLQNDLANLEKKLKDAEINFNKNLKLCQDDNEKCKKASNDLQKNQKTKEEQSYEKLLQVEREKSVQLLNDLNISRNQIASIQNDYNSIKAQSEGKSNEILQLKKQLATADEAYKSFEKLCKENLNSLSLAAQERSLKLDQERTDLLTKIKALEDEGKTEIKQNDKEIQQKIKCDDTKKKIVDMRNFILRQVEIYEISTASIVNSPSWDSFKTANGQVYERGKMLREQLNDTYLNEHPCDQIAKVFIEVEDVTYLMMKLENMLINLYEDSVGAVRVYVRIKPLPPSIKMTSKSPPTAVVPRGKSVLYHGDICGAANSGQNAQRTFGRFFGVIPESFSNSDIYTGCMSTVVTPDTFQIKSHGQADEFGSLCCIKNDASGLCRVMNQLKDGYHIVLFAYGYSGSGKTRTLLGDAASGEPGIVQLAMANTAVRQINLKAVFELYTKQIDFLNKSFNSGKFIELFNKGGGETTSKLLRTMTTNMVVTEEAEVEAFIPTITNYKNKGITAQEFFQLKTALDNYRLKKRRIKATPNNPQSSRSHLFISFEFMFAGSKGLLTVIDMGGRENPMEVLEMFLEKKPADKSWQIPSLLMRDKKLIPSYIKPHVFTAADKAISWIYDHERYMQDSVYAKEINKYVTDLNNVASNTGSVVQLMQESIFINETINQLIVFFKNKQNPTVEFKLKDMKFPINDKNVYDPTKLLTGNPNANETMGMHKILTLLSTLGGKPSKFVMICNVRQEIQPVAFCQSTKSTLEFAHSIRST